MPDLKNNQDISSHGGARAGAGRKKGSPNKATASIRDAAREYTDEALQALVQVIRDEDAPHAAVTSAANSILDRGFGKPSTVISGDEDGGEIKVATRIEIVGFNG